MRKQEKTNHRQQKVNQILALISGQIKPADISPRMVIYFNKTGGNIYMISGKPVDSNTFHDLLETLPIAGTLITHGREDNQEECYYGGVPFSIYKDNRPF